MLRLDCVARALGFIFSALGSHCRFPSRGMTSCGLSDCRVSRGQYRIKVLQSMRSEMMWAGPGSGRSSQRGAQGCFEGLAGGLNKRR